MYSYVVRVMAEIVAWEASMCSYLLGIVAVFPHFHEEQILLIPS
jgi:hypothetical protein